MKKYEAIFNTGKGGFFNGYVDRDFTEYEKESHRGARGDVKSEGFISFAYFCRIKGFNTKQRDAMKNSMGLRQLYIKFDVSKIERRKGKGRPKKSKNANKDFKPKVQSDTEWFICPNREHKVNLKMCWGGAKIAHLREYEPCKKCKAQEMKDEFII